MDREPANQVGLEGLQLSLHLPGSIEEFQVVALRNREKDVPKGCNPLLALKT